MNDTRTCFAAIVDADRHAADLVLGEFASELIRSGRDVHGLIQCRIGEDKSRHFLIDLHSGKRFPLFQNLGEGSQSCSIDSAALATAGQVLRRAVEVRADLAIANRFGALEAQGGGLIDEILSTIAEGIPFITVVAEQHLSAWRHFTGQQGEELPARYASLHAWYMSIAS